MRHFCFAYAKEKCLKYNLEHTPLLVVAYQRVVVTLSLGPTHTILPTAALQDEAQNLVLVYPRSRCKLQKLLVSSPPNCKAPWFPESWKIIASKKAFGSARQTDGKQGNAKKNRRVGRVVTAGNGGGQGGMGGVEASMHYLTSHPT